VIGSENLWIAAPCAHKLAAGKAKTLRQLVAFLTIGACVAAFGVVSLVGRQSTARPARMSPAAETYLNRAITLFRQQHINSAKMDWPALTQKAYAAAGGAQTTADTYPAIRLIISQLGEKHTILIEPDQARADMTGKASGSAQPPPFVLPQASRLRDGIGLIRLPGFIGSAAQGQTYAQAARMKIDALKQQGVCRFILDLREDTGGNMYPMLDGISGLLEPGLLGTFETPQRKYIPWVLKGGIVAAQPPQDTRPIASVNRTTLPVAVLIGPHTGSSGEFTAMSLEGRANTRFFGAPTAGYVTGNVPVTLSDGALILMTSSAAMDRTGKKHLDRIEPDEKIGMFDELLGSGIINSAVKWLSAQHCSQPSPSAVTRR
jgi:C-terminal processing protease CtpA/Prc